AASGPRSERRLLHREAGDRLSARAPRRPGRRVLPTLQRFAVAVHAGPSPGSASVSAGRQAHADRTDAALALARLVQGLERGLLWQLPGWGRLLAIVSVLGRHPSDARFDPV